MIERASRGTLFLDEIGDLEPTSQVKLLRLLQEREYYPLGSDIRKISDARIVVATNRPLEDLIKDPQFRQDLYFRLRTHHIDLPPLRERRGDIPLLLDAFIQEAATQLNRPAPGYTQELIDLLSAYHFPGNIRELESMVIDAVSRTIADTLDIEIFRQAIGEFKPLPAGEAGEMSTVKGRLDDLLDVESPTLKEMNQLLIDKALDRSEGNQTSAARLLGISRQALNKRLKRAEDD